MAKKSIPRITLLEFIKDLQEELNKQPELGSCEVFFNTAEEFNQYYLSFYPTEGKDHKLEVNIDIGGRND